MRFSETITTAPQLQREIKMLIADFGDGYKQRQEDGINARRQRWSLSFQHVTDLKANRIIDFLESVGATTAFIWQPPAPHPCRMFVAVQPFSHEVGRYDDNTIQVTFEEDKNPTAVDQCDIPTIVDGSPSGTIVPVTITAGALPAGALVRVNFSTDGSEPSDPTENFGTIWTPAEAMATVFHTGDIIKAVAYHPTRLPSEVVRNEL